MAKSILGRGLGQILEAHQATVPADGSPVEERPAARLGMGVRTLLTPADPPAPTPPTSATLTSPPPDAGTTRYRAAPAMVTTRCEPSSPRPQPPATVILSLFVADALLCLLAGILLCHPAIGDGLALTCLAVLAIAIGAWLSCQAAELTVTPDG